MTGENFKGLNRKNSAIEKLKEELQSAKESFTKYAKNADEESWSFITLNKLENEIMELEYELDCAIYEDNRRRNWK
ncbi:hypothetical protein [Paenibacillus sp. XY044]|uniref:hypothetical protein n=1 Tax=Paenibacillus sp. XY044 TaxID=2026089 RepID=UPI000B98BB53|nr:hypothetical protein [Paenibacillus sp. XY044]OZB98048.1 hypothetical protein CJP46_02460 [Paenibacillus sp. XY044]